MDFAGYTDIALGVSGLFGIKIMENFNKPLLKTNIASFWRSWHISVYSWIRDYFFLPFFGYKTSKPKLYVGVFMTMVVFMLWHAGNINFFLLGIYHGLGLVVWNLFQEFKYKSNVIRSLARANIMKPFFVGADFYLCKFWFPFFRLDIYQINKLLTRMLY